MELHSGGQLPYPSADFENAILDYIELSPGPLGSLESLFTQRVQQDVCDAVKKQPELIGRELVARGAVRMEKGLVVFDEAFHSSPRTIDALDCPRTNRGPQAC